MFFKELPSRTVFPWDPGYHEARMDYNTDFSKFPLGIAYCNSTEEVVNTLRWARRHSLPFRIRCGGHSYEAFSLVSGGVVIDISPMKGVYVDNARGVACVGAGISLLDLYRALWREGVTIPGGTCPTVGISGLALGGGFGMLTRKMGMTCDNIIAAEVVTADGDIIYANDWKHSGLMWALRGGGGGNFGIVTRYFFRVHPVSYVSVYKITWNRDDAFEAINTWQNWAPFTDERLTTIFRIFTPEGEKPYSEGEFLGNENELRWLLRPLLKAGNPVEKDIRTLPYIDAVYKFDGFTPPHKFKHTGAYVYHSLPAEAIGAMLGHMKQSPGKENSVEFQALGGMVSTVHPRATAYFHRDALFNLQYKARWSNDADKLANINWVEKLRRAMLPFTRGTYVNFPDLKIKDWPEEYYGANFNALQNIKSEYDPDNIFCFPQSIPPKNCAIDGPPPPGIFRAHT